ncbi:unnamed protein product [marine sediment metagenome]|uniref:Uncharacterized protein n=1 Tax=marine sediment metagenome TaxID=412755 RepID=X1DGW1_9ZZZZ
MIKSIAPKITPAITCLRSIFLPLNGFESIVFRDVSDFFPILHNKTSNPKVWPNNNVTTKPATAKGNISNSGIKINTPGIPSTIGYNIALIDIFLIELSLVSGLK